MRRGLALAVTLALVAGVSGFAVAQATADWTATLGRHSTKTAVLQADGQTWLPTASVAALVGEHVSIDIATKTITFTAMPSGLAAGVHPMGANAYIDVSGPAGNEARLRVTVESAVAERTIKGSNAFNSTTAGTGQTYVVLGIHVTDVSDVGADLNTSDMFIQDSVGRRYQTSDNGNAAISDSLNNDFTLEAHQTVNGHEVFAVPMGDGPLLFVYAPFQGPAAEFALAIRGYS